MHTRLCACMSFGQLLLEGFCANAVLDSTSSRVLVRCVFCSANPLICLGNRVFCHVSCVVFGLSGAINVSIGFGGYEAEARLRGKDGRASMLLNRLHVGNSETRIAGHLCCLVQLDHCPRCSPQVRWRLPFSDPASNA